MGSLEFLPADGGGLIIPFCEKYILNSLLSNSQCGHYRLEDRTVRTNSIDKDASVVCGAYHESLIYIR